MSKGKYKVRNWSEYNNGLKQRGAISIWISKEVLEQWRYQGENKRGGQFIYSNLAIEACVVVRQVYHLALRQTQGFMESFFALIKAALPVPCYTQISRRSACLELKLSMALKAKAVTDIVVDATGLKVYGEGEWKVRMHGWGKHRSWMKLHVALNAESQQAEAVELSTNAVDDAALVDELLKKVKGVIGSFTGDGAYDKDKVRKALHQRVLDQGEDLLQCMPPQHNAVVDTKAKAYLWQRNEDIKAMRRLGTKQWKVLTGYHQRSKAETFMYRYKVILGGALQARKFENQQTEVQVGCKILNLMLHIAKPQSERVA